MRHTLLSEKLRHRVVEDELHSFDIAVVVFDQKAQGAEIATTVSMPQNWCTLPSNVLEVSWA